MENAVIEMLKRSAAIPSMPQVAARFLEIIQDTDFDYRDVVEVLSSDPGIASEILRLANSALFGVARHVSSLPQALTLLGMRRVRSLVLGRYIVEGLDRKHPTGIDVSYYWHRSLTCAVVAGQFAATLEPQSREEAFISGLLADVGTIILAEAMPTDYASLAAQYKPNGEPNLARKEVALLGISHGHASAVVLAHWQLPDVVCEAVNRHPWELDEADASPLARLVGAADLLSKYLCDREPDLDRVVQVCCEISSNLHVTPERVCEILSQIEPQISEFAQTLRIQMPSLATCQKLIGVLRERMLEPQTVTIG
jgi:HD-like signal output (HDOD) protein